MDDMREIVSVEQVQRLFLLLAVALPILGVAVGAGLGARRGQLRRCALQGLLIGALGPVNLVLWFVYNRITDRLGLDTVKNLLVNLALFVTLGIVAGLVAGSIVRKNQRVEEPPEPAAQGSTEP